MKKRILFLCALFPLVSNAQSFLPATLITQNHDTLSGYVRVDYGYDFIRFKRGITGIPVNYKVPTINTLLVNGLVYKPRTIDNQIVLMQQMVSGKASLFVQRRKPFAKDRFFLEKDTVFVELIRKSSEVRVNGQLYNETYQNHLSLYSKILNDCNEFTNQKWPTGFDEKSFIELISAYNTCAHTANSLLPKSIIYPAFKKFPVRWFMNAGVGVSSSLPYHTKAALDHYVTNIQTPLGGYINLSDQASSAQINNFITANLGFECGKLGNTNSWGGMLGFSSLNYAYHINTRGIINSAPNDFSFVDPAGVLHDDLPPPIQEQPIQFDGESREKAFIAQADLFIRHYWLQDKSRIYFGTGAGYGIRTATFVAPVKVYLANGSYQGMAVRDAESATYTKKNFDFLLQAGWEYFIHNGRSVGFSFQYNSFYSNRIALLLNYSF
ncbi:hypothetical protein [Spirosoma profusum]|uniref:hypothetical protein n=1 Tax=Spirosoma profusum TaxID=2771354 RepID=UPI001682CDCD|nr:hypothetical protein [Spirosoma profusum]